MPDERSDSQKGSSAYLKRTDAARSRKGASVRPEERARQIQEIHPPGAAQGVESPDCCVEKLVQSPAMTTTTLLDYEKGRLRQGLPGAKGSSLQCHDMTTCLVAHLREVRAIAYRLIIRCNCLSTCSCNTPDAFASTPS